MTRILLVGCGKMGGALLSGWLDQGIAPQEIVIIDPEDAELPSSGLRRYDRPDLLPDDFFPDLVLLAVKPQKMEAVLPAYRHLTGTLFVSIAAGRTLASLASGLGDDAAIIRAMPNLPAAVRRGVTVLLANDEVSHPQRQICEQLLRAVGDIAWIDDEALMDAITALSGSGPAYVFLMVEALAEAGESLGLASALAAQLARATVVGAGEMLRQSPLSAATLRDNVTSPNGTTYAALQVLAGHGSLTELLSRAVAAAARRARELAE